MALDNPADDDDSPDEGHVADEQQGSLQGAQGGAQGGRAEAERAEERGPDRSTRTSKPRKAGEKRKTRTNFARINDARAFEAKEKAKEIVALRLQGYRYREIAERVGCHHSAVGSALERELKTPVPGALDLKRSLLREITIVREGLMRDFIRVGDRLGRALDDPEAGPDGISKLVGARNGTAARIIAAHERLAKLDGLDKPTETIVSGSLDVDVRQVDQTRDELISHLDRIVEQARKARGAAPSLALPAITVEPEPEPECTSANEPVHEPPSESHDAEEDDDDEPL